MPIIVNAGYVSGRSLHNLLKVHTFKNLLRTIKKVIVDFI